MTGSGGEEAYAAALSGLPSMGPATLVALLRQIGPRQAWEGIRAGSIRRPEGDGPPGPGPVRLPLTLPPGRPAPGRSWREAAGRVEPERWWEPIARKGIRVTWPGQATYPAQFECDPRPPGVLFWRGSLHCLKRPCVAVIGTRSATPDGRAVAFELGRDLAAAGICVVSGLALGIDGAAHTGALVSEDADDFAGPVGVAASGVDVPYPRQHARLWESVAKAGAVVSENLPGRPAQAWRFPSRNRVIAALVRLVVVVESHAGGGSMITVEAALERGIDVRVVPGPVHSSASAGTNQLLYEGPGPVRNARDVLDALGMFRPDPVSDAASRRPGLGHDRPAGAVLAALGWRPASLGQLIGLTGMTAAETLHALDRLEAVGQVARHGGWWCRVGPG